MRADTRHWRGYYHDPATESFDLSYSLSDRIRYYWPHPDVQRACASMLENLRRRPIPPTPASQYCRDNTPCGPASLRPLFADAPSRTGLRQRCALYPCVAHDA